MKRMLPACAIAALSLAVHPLPSRAANAVTTSIEAHEPPCSSAAQPLDWHSTDAGALARVDAVPLRGRRVWIDARTDHRHESALNLSLLLAFDPKADGTMRFGQGGQLFAAPREAATTTLTAWVWNEPSEIEVRLPPDASDAAKDVRLEMRCSKRTWHYGDPSDQQALLDEALDLYLAKAIKAPSDASKVRRQAQGWATGAEDPNDVMFALRNVLFNLDDHHSYLVPRNERNAFFAMLAPKPPVVDMRADGIALVQISQVAFDDERSGTAYAQALGEAVSRVAARRPRGWIVDLRQFGGGNMWIVLAGLSSLVDGPLVGEFVSNDRREPWLVSRGRAGTVDWPAMVAIAHHDTRAIAAPVAVLIGPGTGSSGESTAVAFEGRRRTRFFGQPTLGLYDSGVRQYTLSDGTMFGIASTRFADRTGRVYDGAIAPDQRVAPTEDAQAVAAQWLLRQPAVVH